MPRALFLDRDGVINVDKGYVHRWDDVEFIDGIFALCRSASARGYLVVVVTNQAGIGRGFFAEAEFLQVSQRICAEFEAQGALIEKIYYCPFHPEHGKGSYRRDSPDRKPEPGMILRAARELGIDLSRSILVGDRESDIEAGVRAGIPCNLLFHAAVDTDVGYPTRATAVVRSLRDVEPFLVSSCIDDSQLGARCTS